MSWDIVMRCPTCGMLRQIIGWPVNRGEEFLPSLCSHERSLQQGQPPALLDVVHVEQHHGREPGAVYARIA